jgi:hypothetical protein
MAKKPEGKRKPIFPSGFTRSKDRLKSFVNLKNFVRQNSVGFAVHCFGGLQSYQ